MSSRQTAIGEGLVTALTSRHLALPFSTDVGLVFDYREFVADEAKELAVTTLTASVYPMDSLVERATVDGGWREEYGYSIGIRCKLPAFVNADTDKINIDPMKETAEGIARWLSTMDQLEPAGTPNIPWDRINDVPLSPECIRGYLIRDRAFVVILPCRFQMTDDGKP